MALRQMTMWELAMSLSPCRTHAYKRWFDVDVGTLSQAAQQRAVEKIRKRHKLSDPWDRPDIIERVMQQHCNLLREHARHIIDDYLPPLIRNAFLSEPYFVKAKFMGHGDLADISKDELYNLKPSLRNGCLSNGETFYNDVCVFQTRRGRSKDTGYNDLALLMEMKQLIDVGGASSANAAARMIEAKAEGASPEQKIRRLRDKYIKWERKGFPHEG